MRSHPRHLKLGLVIGAVVAACGLDHPNGPLPIGRVYLPSYPSPCATFYNRMPCVVTGRAIVGTLRASGTCVWLTLENGIEVGPYWPEGFAASFGPLRIYDAAGTFVAGEADRIVANGNDPFEGETADSCGRRMHVNLADPIVEDG